MKIVKSLSAAFVAALVLSACGGGGGGSSPAPVVPVVVSITCPDGSSVANATDCPVVVVTPTTPVVPVVVVTPTPVVVSITCPDGSTVANATDCPAVGTGPIALQGTAMSPTALDQGVTLQFSGALNPSSPVVLMKQGNFVLPSSWTLGGGNKDLTFKPATMRAGYGQAVTVVITATDTIGRAVAVSFSFATEAMSCTSNAVWSNPATLGPLQDCVAPVGVQALVTPSLNTMTDTSCVPTVGTALSASCKAYMANGTILLADTSIVVQNNAMMWMVYVSADGKSNLVLLDTVTMAPIGTMAFSGDLAWIIGNPTGAAISAMLRSEQVKWDGEKLVATCYKNCP